VEIIEIKALGDKHALLRCSVALTITPKETSEDDATSGAQMSFSGATMTILEKIDGRWLMTHDYNTVVNKNL
jgi:hypothetical protein